MIYRLDDLCESQDFEHDQKFVKAEHWKEACDEIEDKVKTIAFKDQEITRLKKALEIASEAIGFYANTYNWASDADNNPDFYDCIENDFHDCNEDGYKFKSGGKKAIEAQKQIKEIMEG